MKQPMRSVGLSCLEEAPWGTRICHLYESREDLFDILVPYFRAGIENNEYCIWVYSDPVQAGDAKSRLVHEVADANLARRVEVIPYSKWYSPCDPFQASASVVRLSWKQRLHHALQQGFSGLRIAYNMCFLARDQRPTPVPGEGALYSAIAPQVIECYSYPLVDCKPAQMLQLANNHQVVLLKQGDRWQAEWSGRLRGAQLETLMDTVSESVLIVDEQGAVLGANENGAELMRRACTDRLPATLAGISRGFLLAPAEGEDQADLMSILLDERRQAGAVWHGVYSGKRISFSVNARRMAGDGDAHRYMVLFSDVSEEAAARRAAEEEAAKFAEFFEAVQWERDMWRSVFDAMPVGVTIFDASGKILESNRANLHLFGLPSRPEYVPLPADLRFPDGTIIPLAERPTRRVLSGEEIVGFEACIDTPEGKRVDLLISGGRLNSPGEARFYRICHDITELRKLERAKDDFMMVVSHELRNPLQVISGLVQLLSKKQSLEADHKRDAHLVTLKRQVMVLTSMVEDILAAYRIGSGKLSVEIGDVDVVQLLNEVMAPYINLTTHKVSFELARDSSPTASHALSNGLIIKADSQRLTQVLQNLLSNALKYTPGGKNIWVRLLIEEDCVLITVEDEGIGIPEAQLELVFQGFHRAHKFDEWRSGGVGLGLYISRQLARKHGGELWAERRSEGGTIMKLRLPLQQARPASAQVW